MRQFLRTVRIGRWHKPDIDWLAQGEIQSDAFCDIQTKENKLSVYLIKNENDLLRVITAVAANRDNLSNVDYAVFDESYPKSFGIVIRQTEGRTPDATVNKMHFEFEKLTVRKLANLAGIISDSKPRRILEKRIKLLLQDAVNTDSLDKTRIKVTVRAHEAK